MAGVVKWLRPRFVVPIFVGSSPIIRPIKKNPYILRVLFYYELVWGREPSNAKHCSKVRARVSRGIPRQNRTFVWTPFNANEQDSPIIRPH